MNVFQYTEALDALLVAHKAGLISNENLARGTWFVVELFNAQPEGAKTGVKLDSPRFFAAYTAEQFVTSPAFMAIALPDAIRLIAKTNGRTAESVALAFNVGMPTVVNQAAKLIAKAAQHCADEANACRLYADKPVAVILGRAAYIEGASLDHCNPFVEGSALAVEWAQGWREAQDEGGKPNQLAIVERLKAITDEFDEEKGHIEADGILCELLAALGYSEVVAAYEAIEKWYA